MSKFNNKLIIFVYLLFFLSGFSGLIYQLAWSQQLTLVFGSTEPAIATVLAAYMAGLALGSYTISVYLNKISKPVLAYSVFEALIAFSALSVPLLLSLLDNLFIKLFSSNELTSSNHSFVLFYLMGAFIVLLIPTFLMGATLPLLTKYSVKKSDNSGEKVGKLYAVNTLGACAGSLFASFVLLPNWGLKHTVSFAVAINILIFVLGIIFFRKTSQDTESTVNPKVKLKNSFVLVIMMLSGIVALSQEVIWTRLLSHILGGSVYSFGVMLFIFLAGIGLGSYLGSWFCKVFKIKNTFVLLHLFVGLFFWLSFVNIEILPKMITTNDFGSFAFLVNSIFVGAVSLFPGSLLLGALFPVSVSMLSVRSLDSPQVTAKLYSWNTIGAIIGALIMGFYLLPNLGFTNSSKLLASISIGLALLSSFLYVKNHLFSGLIALIFLIVWFKPVQEPFNVLKYSVLGQKVQKGDVDFFAVGSSSTVLALADGTEKRLLTNGLPESSFEVKGSRSGKFYLANWLSMLPLVSRPEAKDMLIIGLGAGKTLNSVPDSIENIDLIELEEEVLKVNKNFSDWRQDQPLKKKNLEIHINDARNALKQSHEHFDAIVSQPSHPWTSGAANLYTKEFFHLVKNRLNKKGVFVQWIGMRFVDAGLLRSLLASLNSEFKYIELYQPLSKGGLVFLSSNSKLDTTRINFEKQDLNTWRQIGVTGWEDFEYSKRISSDAVAELVKNSRVSSDAFNVLKIRSPKVIKNPLNLNRFDRMIGKFDPFLNNDDTSRFHKRIIRLIVDNQFERVKKYILKTQDQALKRSFNRLLDSQQKRSLMLSTNEIMELRNKTTFILEMFILLNEFNNVFFDNSEEILSQSSLGQIYLDSKRFIKLRKWEQLKALDLFWGDFDTDSLLYPIAINFRYKWRMSIGDVSEKKVALNWIDELLAKKTNINLYIDRFKVSESTKQYYKAFASLLEINKFLQANEKKDNSKFPIESVSREIKKYAKLIPIDVLTTKEHKQQLLELF